MLAQKVAAGGNANEAIGSDTMFDGRIGACRRLHQLLQRLHL